MGNGGLAVPDTGLSSAAEFASFETFPPASIWKPNCLFGQYSILFQSGWRPIGAAVVYRAVVIGAQPGNQVPALLDDVFVIEAGGTCPASLFNGALRSSLFLPISVVVCDFNEDDNSDSAVANNNYDANYITWMNCPRLARHFSAIHGLPPVWQIEYQLKQKVRPGNQHLGAKSVPDNIRGNW